jgi:hypothetical protein
MMLEPINPKRSIPRLQQMHDAMTNERRRTVLGAALRHSILESEPVWDVDQIMGTLVAEPRYHIWVDGSDVGPKGADAVRAFYQGAVQSKATLMQFDVERVVVDDRCAVLEGFVRQICTSAMATSLGMPVDELDADDDPERQFLVVYRTLTVMPVDEHGLIEGEDVYISGPASVSKLSRDELAALQQ